MSKQLVMQYWCDVDRIGQDGLGVRHGDDAETYLICVSTTGELKEVEVCEQCRTQMPYDKIVALAREKGRERTDPSLDPELCCTYADCKRATKPFKDKGGRRRHLTRVHGEAPAR